MLGFMETCHVQFLLSDFQIKQRLSVSGYEV
jgi:hypothetical protein